MARRMLQSASLRFALGVLCSVPLAACNGVLGDPDAHVEDGGDDGTIPPQDDPGRVTIHRLNNIEYNNTVRDLLGTAQRPADNFPADPHTYGFDNNADALTLSPSHFELHERAVESMIDEALLGGGAGAVVNKVEGEVAGGSVGVATANAWNLYSNGTVQMTQAVETPGTYRVRARVWQDEAGDEAARSTINVDGQVFGPFDVTATTAATAQILEQEVELTAGPAIVSVSFDNDFNGDGDRNLYVDYIEVEGPLGLDGGPATGRDKILSCDFADEGEPCVRQILGDFAERAWRRPVTDAEIDALYALVDLADQQGDGMEVGIKLALRATLTSANFLYRPELDEDPTSVTPHPLSSWEMASRLSYFLWSSMPDDALFDLARGDRLQDDAEIDKQIDRMLQDPKALAMVENFAGQWLFTRAIASHEVNSTMFPQFDQELRDAMAEEANLYFMEFLRDDTLTLDQLVESDFTFLNDRLAEHYGLPAPGSASLVRVALDGQQRGGVLRQGGLLTATSNPDRTSPVKRGKWVMSNLLCEEPPPPPDAVTVFEQGDLQNLTGKELLAKHREQEPCKSCHNLFDPIGVGFENYDAIGVWRTTDKGKPIDPVEATPDYAFQTPQELASLIADDPRFTTCAAEKMVIYGTGRGPNAADDYHVGDIEKAFVASGRNLKTLIKLVVKSKPFRERRGEKGAQ